MYRFQRMATIRTAAQVPAALSFAAQVTEQLNSRYGLNMRFGAEQFGASRIHWYFDIDSLDKLQQIYDKLMQDREYAALLEKFQDTWVDGSMRDSVTRLL